MLSGSRSDSLIRYLNNLYLDSENNEIEIKLQLVKKKQALIISQERAMFAHFCGLNNVFTSVCSNMIMKWSYFFLLHYSDKIVLSEVDVL